MEDNKSLEEDNVQIPEEESPKEETPMIPLKPATPVENRMIMGVKARIINSMEIVITYDNNRQDVTVVKLNDIICVRYIHNNELCIASGRIYELRTDYISIDCSSEFNSNTVKILVPNIRDIEILRDGLIQPR